MLTDSAVCWMVAETPLLWRSVHYRAFSYTDSAAQKITCMYKYLCLQWNLNMLYHALDNIAIDQLMLPTCTINAA